MYCVLAPVSSIGANWGNQASHPLPPDIVVQLLKDNGFQKVKLFDAEDATMKALGNSQMEVMVGIPNDMLAILATSVKAAEKWVSKNVSSHMSKHGVNIRNFKINASIKGKREDYGKKRQILSMRDEGKKGLEKINGNDLAGDRHLANLLPYEDSFPERALAAPLESNRSAKSIVCLLTFDVNKDHYISWDAKTAKPATDKWLQQLEAAELVTGLQSQCEVAELVTDTDLKTFPAAAEPETEVTELLSYIKAAELHFLAREVTGLFLQFQLCPKASELAPMFGYGFRLPKLLDACD
ncbi:hypothetical protein ACLOJK_037078 [Asimina triloba]